jgi:ABC-2 type transport system ATP-binding protein
MLKCIHIIEGVIMAKQEQQAVVTAANLSKKYGKLNVVDAISFSVLRGEVLGFLGPNGAGKTTTIKMLSGLLKPSSGTIVVSGNIGICPQEIVIYEGLTCLEQLRFMGEMHGMKAVAAKAKSLELLAVMGLSEKKDKLAKTLSGGMQRRLNIALALVHSPDIIFLDEPQAGLDPQSRLLVREYIKALTTHDMEEAEKLSDRVCIIDSGKILACGTVNEIKNSIGQGDLFEIETDGGTAKTFVPVIKKIKGVSHIKTEAADSISFMSAGDKTFAAVMSAVKKKKIKLVNFRMRKTSLEDVFISLTGRGLRE